MRNIFATITTISLILTASLCHAASGYTVSPTPRLTVEIIASHLRYDYLARIYRNLTETGIKRLIDSGTVYTAARYNYMFTQDSPGITTLMTGTQPSQHGIIGDRWINYTTNEVVSAIGDDSVIGVGCNEDEGQFSPHRLAVSNVGDELRRADPRSKVISIALDPEGAILAGGTEPTAAYWFDGRYGRMVTSTYYTDKLPDWVERFNARDERNDYASALWHVTMDHNDYVFKKSSAIMLDTTLKFSFENIFRPKNRDYRRLRETPFGNTLLTDFAIEAIDRDSLGADDIPDLMIIDFGAQKYISEYYGVESTELEDAYYKLDRDIARILSHLDTAVGRDNYAVVFTSDHGISDNVRAEGGRYSSGTFNAIQFRVLINSFLSARLGEGVWVSEYRNRQVYLNRRLIYERKLSLPEIQNDVATFAIQFGGVAQAVTATTLATNYYGRGIAMKIQNSFYPKHSGDVIINLMPGWIELENEAASWVTASSGSPYEYDVHVPLVFYGAGIGASVVERSVDMTDVAPTVSDLLGVSHPNACEGHILGEIKKRQ